MSAKGCFLGVDTSTEACSVALWHDGEVQERFAVVEREHTRRLLPMVKDLLAATGRSLAQLDGIACGIGPGSFSGVRIGVGFVKGLALARGLPVVGISSLAMLAARAARLDRASHVAAVIDARMKEVYFGAYRREPDGGLASVLPELCCEPAAVPRLPGGRWVGAGTGWGAHGEALWAAVSQPLDRVDPAALPHAEEAVRLAVPRFSAGQGRGADELVPAYLRDRVALTLAEQASRRSGS